MYVVLTGAKKNLGDFLITERAEALLREFRPEHELERRPSWEPLDLELAREAKAIIILGGPGYQPNLFPGIYPFTDRIDAVPCPIIPMGLGWKGVPGDDLTLSEYTFSPRSLEALRWMEQRAPYLGCRDWFSQRVLARHGLNKTLMTGCPVWFHLPSRGQAMKLPAEVKRLVYTPPQLELFSEQSVEIATDLAKRWPEAERIAAFHRGIGNADTWTDDQDARHTRRLAQQLEALGFVARDVSGELEKIDFYAECDLHVGYRVHAHIYFLSRRLPSLLVHEDGRGRGTSHALGVEGVDAFCRPPLGQLAVQVQTPAPIRRRLLRRLGRKIIADPAAPASVRQLLSENVQTDFARYAGVAARIDAQLGVMQRFLRSLP